MDHAKSVWPFIGHQSNRMVDVVGKGTWKEHAVGKPAVGKVLFKLERIEESWEVSSGVGKFSRSWEVKLKSESVTAQKFIIKCNVEYAIYLYQT